MIRKLTALFWGVSALVVTTAATAQDTLSVTLLQAGSLFLRHNLQALAGRFQIESAQAQIVQAQLYENPIVSLEFNAFNPVLGQAFDVGQNGQKALSIQQTILLAGKRSKRVAVATLQSRLTELQFADLLRTLRFDVHSRFFSVFFTNNTLQVYIQRRIRLTETIAAFERQYAKTNVALKELVRLKALLLQLTNDQLELQNQLIDQQRDLRILLQTSQSIRPVLAIRDTARYNRPLPTLQNAVNFAFENRPDLQASAVAIQQADANVNLQRALAKPDMRVGALYDQNASYVNNYIGLTVGVDVPVFNRNQGNIRSALAQGQFTRLGQRTQQTVVENEVRASLEQIQQTNAAFQGIDPSFPAQFDELSQNVLRNFEKGNIALIEFVDLFETYLENVRQLNRLRADRITAYEQLTYVIGTDLFK